MRFLTWLAAVVIVWLVLSVVYFCVSDEWKKRGLYVWRTRKPSAFFGIGLSWWLLAAVALGLLLASRHGPWWLAPLLLVLSGRHTAYFGQTSSRYYRDDQHLFGTKSYWSDLSPRAYPWPCYFPGWEWAREFQEKFWIKVLLPVYNDTYNHHNPRRISRERARDMRIKRQMGGRRFNLTYALLRLPFTLACYLGVYLMGDAWNLWPGWIVH